MSLNATTADAPTSSGSKNSPMGERTFAWKYENREYPVKFEYVGSGPNVLLAPPMSTVSSRDDLRGLANAFKGNRTCVMFDWPAQGHNERVSDGYQPAVYAKFLTDFVKIGAQEM